MKKRADRQWFFIVCIVVASVVVLWPLLQRGLYISDDGEWMVIRLSAFYQSLASGQFPVRFLGRLNHSYGYPVSNFLYPGFLYIGSLLHIAGFSFIDAVKLILALSVIGASFLTYFALRKSISPFDSCIGAVSLLFSPYLLYDLYVRGSVGEVLSLVPASGLLYALSVGSLWIVSPLIGFLILSHNTMALLFGAVYIVLFIVRYGCIRMFLHAALGFGMAAFFWMPALFERQFVRFDAVRIAEHSRYFITPETGMLLGVPTLLSIAVIIGRKVKLPFIVLVMCVLTCLSIYMALPASSFLWPGTLSQYIQFPYRFIMISVVLGPWAVAYAIKGLKRNRRIVLISIFFVLWLYSILSIQNTIRFVDREIGYYTTNEGTTTVADEFMPRWAAEVPRERTQEALEVIDGNVNIASRRFPKESITTTFEAKSRGTIQINKVYYPGWRVAIDDIPVEIDYRNNSFGFMQIQVCEGKHQIKAAFKETPFRFATDVISLISCIVYIAWFRRIQSA